MLIRNARPTILLLGLEDNLAQELSAKLGEGDSRVFESGWPEDCSAVLERFDPDLVFCPSERPHFFQVLAAAQRSSRRVPVVAVSRQPEVSEWLDAMEAGASDYCGAPFESRDIDWIVSTNLASSGNELHSS